MNTALRSREIFALVYTDKQTKKKKTEISTIQNDLGDGLGSWKTICTSWKFLALKFLK